MLSSGYFSEEPQQRIWGWGCVSQGGRPHRVLLGYRSTPTQSPEFSVGAEDKQRWKGTSLFLASHRNSSLETVVETGGGSPRRGGSGASPQPVLGSSCSSVSL